MRTTVSVKLLTLKVETFCKERKRERERKKKKKREKEKGNRKKKKRFGDTIPFMHEELCSMNLELFPLIFACASMYCFITGQDNLACIGSASLHTTWALVGNLSTTSDIVFINMSI